MKLGELREFDAAEALEDDETIRHYLSLAFEGRDPREIQRALSTVTRARGMSARRTQTMQNSPPS